MGPFFRQVAGFIIGQAVIVALFAEIQHVGLKTAEARTA